MEKITLNQQAQIHNLIIAETNVHNLIIYVANTEQGALDIRLPRNGTGADYRFHLGGVHVSDTTNASLMEKIGETIILNYGKRQ